MINPHIVRKTTNPTSAPPEVGIHWINTVTSEEYFSVGTSSVNDWLKRGTINYADALQTTCYNNTGVTIPAFSVVYINGSQGTIPTVALSQANNEGNSSKTYGVTYSSIPNNGQGTVIAFGLLQNVNTNAYPQGSALWLSPTIPGGVTTTKPSSPNHMVFVGNVTRSHPTQGRVEVRIQNGFELDELHNVSALSPINGQTIRFNSTSNLWEKHTLVKGDVGLGNVDNTSDLDKPISNDTQNALNTKQNALGFTPENIANKSTSTSLGTSNTLYPTQNAVKSYVDSRDALKVSKSGDTMTGELILQNILSTSGEIRGFDNVGNLVFILSPIPDNGSVTVFSSTAEASLTPSLIYVAEASGGIYGTYTGITPGKIELFDEFGNASIPTQPVHVTTKAYVDNLVAPFAYPITTENIVISQNDIDNKMVTLANTPVVPSSVTLMFLDGIHQINGIDYSVSGDELSWDSLGLDGFIELGDTIVIQY